MAVAVREVVDDEDHQLGRGPGKDKRACKIFHMNISFQCNISSIITITHKTEKPQNDYERQESLQNRVLFIPTLRQAAYERQESSC